MNKQRELNDLKVKQMDENKKLTDDQWKTIDDLQNQNQLQVSQISQQYQQNVQKLETQVEKQKRNIEDQYEQKFSRVKKGYVEAKLSHHINEQRYDNQKEDDFREIEKSIESKLKKRFFEEIEDLKNEKYELINQKDKLARELDQFKK